MDEEILPGFRVVIRAGHSPGHTQYFVESGGQPMMTWGNLTHFEWVQLPDPALTIAFDFNQTETRQYREELIDLLLEKKYLVAAAHIAFPGMSHLRRAAEPGFEWVPIRYDSELTRNTTADFGFDNSSTSGPTTFSASTPKSGGNVWRTSFAYILVAAGVYRMLEF
ncbi:hypothetical protein BV898_16474 [Hypsibius exemplaris]|uniref:Metallo-beta-lactamase domain-containing protein n=1 Tax=Hypsibius exemplaris TaxID=2072580 RepID=A0A9X6NFD8_HYPEX|nr:hypothetical protein BV898_16474 [Hypsibius exemplaris]